MTLSDDAKRLLDGVNFAHLSTLQADGAPKVPNRQPYLKSEMQSRTIDLYQSMIESSSG